MGCSRLFGLSAGAPTTGITKNSTLAKCFKVEELRIHVGVQPLIWHALFVALLLAEERQLSPQTLGNVSLEDSIPLGFNNNAAENSDGIFITRPPPKCNRLLHVFFISIISGQPTNGVFSILPKSKRQTPPRIKGFFFKKNTNRPERSSQTSPGQPIRYKTDICLSPLT